MQNLRKIEYVLYVGKEIRQFRNGCDVSGLVVNVRSFRSIIIIPSRMSFKGCGCAK